MVMVYEEVMLELLNYRKVENKEDKSNIEGMITRILRSASRYDCHIRCIALHYRLPNSLSAYAQDNATLIITGAVVHPSRSNNFNKNKTNWASGPDFETQVLTAPRIPELPPTIAEIPPKTPKTQRTAQGWQEQAQQEALRSRRHCDAVKI